MLSKLSYLNSNIAMGYITLGYLNPALTNSALFKYNLQK